MRTDDNFITYWTYYDPIWRRFLMWLGLEIGRRAFDLLKNVPDDRIVWQDHLRWFLEGIGNELFGRGYDGSGAELASALNDEIPWQWMNARQKAEFIAVRGFPPHLDSCGYADFTTQQLLLEAPQHQSA